MAGVSVYSVWKFRARPDDDTDGPPIHGHTGSRSRGRRLPTALVIAIAVLSAVALAKNDSLPSDRLVVEVTARQFAWSFAYPQYEDVGSAQLRLPLGRSVELKIRSLDVIHSFWVPQFGQKQDALPEPQADSFPASMKVTPTKLGRFPVVCTELCGAGHAFMRSWAIVMRPAAFSAGRHKRSSSSRPASRAGRRSVFQEQGCGSCHTFEPAQASATVGPDLDDLPRFAETAGQPLDAFIRLGDRSERLRRAGLPAEHHAAVLAARQPARRARAVSIRLEPGTGRLSGRGRTRGRPRRGARREAAPTGLQRWLVGGWLRVLWMTPVLRHRLRDRGRDPGGGRVGRTSSGP